MSDRPECVVPLCFVPRQHVSECDDTACRGCVPGLAAAGLKTCTHHRNQIERAFQRLPVLHAELEEYLAPYRSPQAPKGDGGRTAEAPDTVNGPAFEIRKLIEGRFYAWCIYLRAHYGLKTWTPTVEAMGAFLATHVDTLCNDPLAAPGVWARLEELLYGQGNADPYMPPGAVTIRNRSRAAGLALGLCPVTVPIIHEDGRAHRSEPCGGLIRYDRQEARFDPDSQPTCPRCGETGSLLWWQQRIASDVEFPALLPAVRLAWFLADNLAPELAAAGRKITASTIGKWKYDETQEPGTGITPTACDLRSKRDLFDRTVVEAFARNRLKLNPESRTA